MLKHITKSTLLVAAIHFIFVVLSANGLGGEPIADAFETVFGQPGLCIARELGFGGFGILDGFTGNKLGLWIVMALNSLLWGVALSTAIFMNYRIIKK